MATAVEVKIFIKGKPLSSFMSLSVRQTILSHHSFSVTCRPDAFDTFSSSGESFVMDKVKDLIGNKIKIEISPIGVDSVLGKTTTIFSGIILEVEGTKYHDALSGAILIRGGSMDTLLAGDHHCRSFENMTIGDIVQNVTQAYSSNLFDRTEINPRFKETLEYVVQYNETNYEFLLRLAKTYGEWYLVSGINYLYFGEPPSNKTDLLHGKDLHEFSFSMRLTTPSFNYTAYNYYEEESITKESKNEHPKLGSYLGDAFATSEDVFSPKEDMHLNLPLSKANAEKELESAVRTEIQSRVGGLNTIRGESDNCEISLGNIVKIDGLTSPGSATKTLSYGEYRIISLYHSCDEAGNYRNHFDAVPVSVETPPYSDPQLHPACDNQSAVVTDTDDPEGIGRVRVKFYWQDKEQSPWIRVITAYAGDNKGMFFIPEIGEEVLVGFEDSNADKPYVIGAHYNGKKKPDDWKSNKNYKKAIRTSSGHTIEFNDEGGKEEIVIYDKDKINTITLSSHDKLLTISCQGDMKIDAENIEITARKDYKLEVQGKIEISSMKETEITATGDCKVQSNQNINIEAMSNLKAKANMDTEVSGMTLAAKGSATAEFSAGGQTVVKGAIVMIN
jgi:type VI secretion system secreted protein VgrG